MSHFIDTSVLIAYATFFDGIFIEKFGENCWKFLKSDIEKITSKNVNTELRNVRRKRTSLYRQIYEVMTSSGDVNELKDLEVGENVRKHLDSVIELIDSGKIEANQLLRLEEQFNSRIRKAKNELINEILDAKKELEKKLRRIRA